MRASPTSTSCPPTSINLWIEGYVFFVEGNSPIESERVLSTQEDINTVIHLGVNNKLKNISKEKIVEILS